MSCAVLLLAVALAAPCAFANGLDSDYIYQTNGPSGGKFLKFYQIKINGETSNCTDDIVPCKEGWEVEIWAGDWHFTDQVENGKNIWEPVDNDKFPVEDDGKRYQVCHVGFVFNTYCVKAYEVEPTTTIAPPTTTTASSNGGSTTSQPGTTSTEKIAILKDTLTITGAGVNVALGSIGDGLGSALSAPLGATIGIPGRLIGEGVGGLVSGVGAGVGGLLGGLGSLLSGLL